MCTETLENLGRSKTVIRLSHLDESFEIVSDPRFVCMESYTTRDSETCFIHTQIQKKVNRKLIPKCLVFACLELSKVGLLKRQFLCYVSNQLW